MLMQEALKMLMKVNRMTQTRAAEYISMNQRAISRAINENRLEISKAIEILDLLGYELILREKTTARRSDDEILINNKPEFRKKEDIEKVKPVEKRGRREGISCREYIISRVGDKKWLNKKEVAEIMGLNYRTLQKRYSEYFVNNLMSIDKLVEIMDNGSVIDVTRQIEEIKTPFVMLPKNDTELAKQLYARIQEVVPGKLTLTRQDIVKITGWSRPTVYAHFNKYFVNNTITINEFITAFQIEGKGIK